VPTIVILFALISSVEAACPGGYTYCDGTSGIAADYCTVNGAGDVVTCDLHANLGGNNTEAWFITPTDTTFRAWGTGADGNNFCCELTVDNGCDGAEVSITIHGTDAIDDIHLHYVADDLDCATAIITTSSSADTINGSESDNAYYNESLRGEDGDDTIHGHTCDDDIQGGPDGDTLLGGEGDDIINGGTGVDWIKGESGDDWLEGGDGADSICGGPDSDQIYGNADSDMKLS
jgi:Ca2+-binding RTX toxin-like protein